MKYYQLTYLISPELKKEEIEKVEKKIASFLKEESGILDKSDSPLMRSLFYPIKKFRKAFLGSCYFFLEPEKLNSLEKKLKAETNILRYLLTSEKPPKKIPSFKKIEKPKKVELEDLEKKLKEVLGQENEFK